VSPASKPEEPDVNDTLLVEAKCTESLISKFCLIASTYSLLTKELVLKPDLSLYPVGTVTVPVPCGERTILLLPAEVETVEPFKVKLSTTKEVIPAISVVVEPLVSVLLPSVMSLVATAPLVTVKFAVANEATPLLLVVASSAATVIVLSVTDVSIPSPPVKVKFHQY